MFAMKRFVTLVDRERFFNTTNKPRLFPNRAIMKITAYTVVMPILIFSGMMNGAGGAPVEFVAKKEIEKVYCFSFNMKGSQSIRLKPSQKSFYVSQGV